MASEGEILRAACNSHARRKIRESTAYPHDRAHWLNWFQALYDIEDRGAVMSPEQRLELRQSEAKPIWDAMAVWLEEVQLRTAGFLTLVSSALRNDLDVRRYVQDVLDQLLAGVTDYEPLLPWNWGAAHPEAIRKYRVEA